LTEAIRVADLGRAVVLAGHVPDQDLPALYAGAALFVYPSFWEGFGLPPLEAMAMGVPVIVYKTASLPEVVGDAGILLDAPYAYTSLAESMERLIADETLRGELVEKGYRQVATFSWERAADQTMAVYAGCVRT
jgi:glycosyltransferase involved in cell wall biosynthesis